MIDLPSIVMPVGIAFVAGGVVATAWLMRHVSPAPGKLELMQTNIALTLVSSAAMDRLEEGEQQEAIEEASEALQDAFGDEVRINVEEVCPDE